MVAGFRAPPGFRARAWFWCCTGGTDSGVAFQRLLCSPPAFPEVAHTGGWVGGSEPRRVRERMSRAAAHQPRLTAEEAIGIDDRRVRPQGETSGARGQCMEDLALPRGRPLPLAIRVARGAERSSGGSGARVHTRGAAAGIH